MNEKTFVSTCTLIGSLAAYYHAKRHNRDVMPSTMIGAFIGTLLGEMIVVTKNKTEQKQVTDGNQK